MSFIAEITIPADSFVLSDVLALAEIDRIVFDCTIPARTGFMPYFWICGSRFDGVEDLLEREPALRSVVTVDEVDKNRLYRAEWDSHVPFFLDATARVGGDIRGATGETDWEFELLFDTQADLGEFTGYFADIEIELTIDHVYRLNAALTDQNDLTPPQREALITAERNGYYQDPQEVTMEELAESLDISIAAVSGRLRRGTSKLVQSTLL